ncbi:MAG: DUF4191 domain-containing protein [Micrococcales bacterium]|nr:DUF4191 domain-containing protein [Micrococcales bacterium]MCL2667894.1 DUF4191 domain-containing protein [Micrococcales bacterium]
MARKSTSADPPAEATKPKKAKKTRWYHNLWQAYKITARYDRKTPWILLGIAVGITAVFAVIGWFTDKFIYFIVLGFTFGLVGALFFLSRRVEVAAYSQIEGQPGAAYAALSTLRRGWTFSQEPSAINPHQDTVFRGVGRPGVVLVSDGPAHRVAKLLESERKRCARVAGGAPVLLVQMGTGEGQVPLRRLTRHMYKLKPVLTKQEVEAVNKRLAAMGGAKLPVPKGVDPMRARPDRKGLRGR